MTETLYVVVGTCGEYSARTEWLVVAYRDEAMARAHAEAAKADAMRIWAEQQAEDRWELAEEPHVTTFDAQMRFESYLGDSGIPDYTVRAVPLRAALPEVEGEG